MEWDEGPGVGGPNGPYTQSERIHIYKEYTDKLISEKKAYRCFCSAEELDGKKNKPMRWEYPISMMGNVLI